jgi:Undecaprenyl-phosphate glucose phosphotransferase
LGPLSLFQYDGPFVNDWIKKGMEYSQAFFLYVATVKLCDVLTVLGVWYGCWYLRFTSDWFPVPKGIPDFQPYFHMSLALVIVFSAVLHVVGAYRRDRIHFGFRSIKKIVQGSTLGTLVFISTLYFSESIGFSRLYLIIFFVLVVFALVTERILLQGLWFLFETLAIRKIRTLLIGTGNLLEMYWTKISQRQPYPIDWVGRLGETSPGHFPGIPYLGAEDQLATVLETVGVDLIVVSYPPESHALYGRILEQVSTELVAVKVLPDFGAYSTFTYSADHECGIPLLHFNQPPVGATDRAMKRLVDILGSLAFLLVFSPLYFTIAVLIKLTSRGPIFYSQERMGADGKLFTLYKFRSMRVNAEGETGAVWAVPNDSRTTPIGKWLRRSSLDEFPQFFNVLKGDMSLVGPRPERPVFVRQFRKEIPKYMLRHKMKSGITGWAQVNGWRGNTSIEERIKHDLYYIGHWSHYFDVKILCLTVLKGFIHRHAY